MNMASMRVLSVLERCGAIRKGHFVLTKGGHSDTYVNKDDIYPDVEACQELCRHLGIPWWGAGVERVVGPALGGIVLSNRVAAFLSDRGSPVRSVYAEKVGGVFTFTRGLDRYLSPEKRVLVVEDIITTGGSVKQVVDLVRAHGCNVLGVACLVNRGQKTAQDLGVPRLTSLVEGLDALTWLGGEAECELCRTGVPINTDVGKGREFLEKKRAAAAG